MMELRDYQQEVHDDCMTYLKQENYRGPAVINASVGAGKSVLIASIARHCSGIQLKDRPCRALVIQRQGELCKQNSDAAHEFGVVKQSVFSASLNRKSAYYPVIFGTEGTIARSLHDTFANFPVDIIMVDECFTGDTMITTNIGKVRIDDPRLAECDVLCVCEDTGGIFWHKPDSILQRGTKDVSCVKTTHGSFECTSTHKIYTGDSWISAQDLCRGQKIVFEDLQSNAITRLLRATAAVAGKILSKILRRR